MPRLADTMIRAIAGNGMVRAFAINSTHLCDRARQTQGTLPAASAALGRLLSASVMMAGTIKPGERISLQVVADGPLEVVFAQATPDGRARGYVRNPLVNPPSKDGKLDVGRAVGSHGELQVIRDLGMSEPYVGRVPLQSGEIGDDLAYYYAKSEQQPSAIGLGVMVEPDNRVSAAGGYIVQPLTGASDAIIALLEYNIRSAPPPSDLILSMRDPAKILDVLLDGMAWQELERITPRFHCGCTRSKSRRAFAALSAEELTEMIAEGADVTVTCDYCSRNYIFTPADLQKILQRK